MEPLVNDPTATVPQGTLGQILSELPGYDEYHLVYALTLGAKHSPEMFAMRLPQYLAHQEGSVWSAAMRCLDGLPDSLVTQALVDSVRRVHFSHPRKAWIGEVLGRLEKRLSRNG